MSLRFDVSGDALTRITNLPATTGFTFMAWVYLVSNPAATTYGALTGFGNGTSQYAIYLKTSDVVRFALTDWAADFNGSALSLGTWYHLAMTASGTSGANLLGYRNGTLEITGNVASITGTTLMICGGPASATEWHDMRVGGVKVYSAVLNATEIAAESASWVPVRTANLNGWYPMTDASVAGCLLSQTPGPTGNDWTAGGTLTIEADPPAADAVTWTQLHYRWRDDNGTEVTASPLAAEDTAITRPTLTNTRLRTLLNPAGGDPATSQIQRQWNRPLANAIWLPIEVLGGAAQAFGAAGATTVTGTTAPTVAYPTGITKGQQLIMFVTNRPNTSTPATPAGWTVLPNSTATGGAGAQSADTGLMRGTIFTREADGTETGNVTLAITGGTTVGAKILRYTKTTGKVWALAVEAGADNTAGTAWSATAAANPGIQAGDLLLICSAPSSDCALASQAVTQPGVTFGTLTNRATDAVATGFDTKVQLDEFPVNSITTVTGPPVFVMTASGTGSASEAGVSLFLRIRQVDAPLVLAVSPNIAAGGTTNTTALLTAPVDGHTFGGGKISDDTNPFPTVDLALNTYGEWETCLQATATALTGEVYRVRDTLNGTPLTTYSQNPEWTIGTPAAAAASLVVPSRFPHALLVR